MSYSPSPTVDLSPGHKRQLTLPLGVVLILGVETDLDLCCLNKKSAIKCRTSNLLLKFITALHFLVQDQSPEQSPDKCLYQEIEKGIYATL